MIKVEKFLISNTKIFGSVLIGIGIGLFFITLSLTRTIVQLRVELHKACPLPPEACPYKSSVPIESVAGLVVSAAVGIFGLSLMLIPESVEGIISRRRRELKQVIKSLNADEKKIYEMLVKAGGSAFQSDLVRETGFSKVKVSRILDRLEVKKILERRRRGLANVVILR